MANLSELKDTFDGPTLDVAKWKTLGNAYYDLNGGTLNIYSGATYSMVKSVDAYTLTNSYVLAKVVHGSTVNGQYAMFELVALASPELARMYYLNGSLYLNVNNSNGDPVINTSTPYSAATMAWWRIRHTAPTIYLETSPDGLAWTVRASAAYAIPVDMALALSAQKGAGTAFTSSFDNVNSPPPPTPKLETLTDDFTTGPLNPAKWTFNNVGTCTVSGGTLNLGASYDQVGTVSSTTTYDLIDSYVYVKMSSSRPGTDNYAVLDLDGPGPERLVAFLGSNYIYFQEFDSAGSNILTVGVEYNATSMAWCRIRNTAGVNYWETSPDGSTWEIRATKAYAVAAAFTLKLTAQGGTGGPYVATFDNVNVPPPYVATLNPNSITDAGTLGDPTYIPPTTITASPDSLTHVETFGDPTGANAAPKMETFLDDFSGVALDPAKWYSSPDGTGIVSIVVNGQLNFTSKASGSGTHVATVYSVDNYDLRNSNFAAQFTLTTASTAPTTLLRLTSTTNGEYFQIQKISTGNLQMRGYNTSGVVMTSLNVAYNASSMAWWRIRNTGSTMYWDTSPNGATWTPQHTYAYTPTAPTYRAWIEYSWIGATSVATTSVDNVNNFPAYSTVDTETFGLPTVNAVGAPFKQLADDFTAGTLDPAKWQIGYTPNSGFGNAAGVTSGRLNLNLTSGYSPPYGVSVSSVEVFDLTDSYLFAQVTPVAGAGQSNTFLRVINPSNPKEYFTIYKLALTLYVKAFDTNGTAIINTSYTFDGTNFAWWRIRHSVDTLYLDTSPTGIDNWTTRGGPYPYTPSNRGMRAVMELSWNSGTSQISAAYFDNINPATDPLPGPVIDGELVGSPAAYEIRGCTPDGITHPETIPDPATIGGLIFGPDPITDPDLLDNPAADVTLAVTVTPTADPETFGDPAATFALNPDVTTSPASITDPGQLGDPDADTGIVTGDVSPDSLVDPQTLGPPRSFRIPSGDLVSTIVDDFSGPLNTDLWQLNIPAGASIGITAGQLEVHIPAGKVTPYSATTNALGLYQMTGSEIFAKVNPSATGLIATGLWVRNPSNTKEFFSMYRQAANLFMRVYSASGTAIINTSTPYSATAHAYWRIRQSGGSFTFATSADGITWTVKAGPTGYNPSTNLLRVTLETTWTSSTSSTDSYSWFDSVNVGGATLLPQPITDVETLGDPAIGGPVNIGADSITDTQTFGDPQLGTPDPIGIPDSIVDSGYASAPDATTAGPVLIGVTTDGINDPDVLPLPTLYLDADTEPDSLTDAELLLGPSAAQPIGVDADGIADPETFGLLALLQGDTPVTVADLVDPETLDDPAADIILFPISLNDAITDGEELGPPQIDNRKADSNFGYGYGIYGDGIYSGYQAPPDTGHTANYLYGTGTYGYGIYYGIVDTTNPPGTETLPIVPPTDYPMAAQNLSIGPWSPGVEWRGAPNYQIPPTRLTRAEAEQRSIGIATGGPTTTRPAMGLPPATRKGFTLRLNESSEARVDLAMQRGDAVVIDEMDTDIWWRRKDPTTGKLEMIGRFNCAHADLTASDSGVNLSAQFVDYSVLLGDRMILTYMRLGADGVPETMWDTGTLVTQILNWALPLNTGIDMSEVRGANPYNLGTITQPFHLPPGTLITDFLENLKAVSRASWEWWVETPEAVDKAPKLRFVVGERGSDKGVCLFDVGSGPTPIASWSRSGSTDDYANTLYFTGGGTGTGENAGGGVVVDIPSQVGLYGQRDAQDGNTSLGGNIDQIRKGAEKKLAALADRTPTFTIGLAFGFWKGREHIDVGDTVRLILRLGKDVTDRKYRVTEIQVDIDDNNMEDVTLTLGRPRASNDPRSKRSPLMRIIRTFRNYKAPDGSQKTPTPTI